MAQSGDVTPVAGRLLRPGKSLGLQRGSVSASGRCSNGAASAAVNALHRSPASAPEAIAPISLELLAWPSEPSTPSATATTVAAAITFSSTDSGYSDRETTLPTAIPPSLRQRNPGFGRFRGHSRANSLDSTTTDSSGDSCASTSSSRSKWNIFAPVLDGLTASTSRPGCSCDQRSKESSQVWREYW
ncbi:hypothetical protein CPLU01_01050 [Colletotrichum plurivorum]|uniref:Uncharacterized protein n=1 Tax=Colletotrichum plurivorum TaxID=2175906 RepID=A0A8H6NQH0_9PEZI|nr:hypothetical protein CPLU01_01050 [Colletotrichum plurivorum]